MSYFESDFQNFFKELAANNNKDWFDHNRQRYEQQVKRPFLRFTEAMIEALGTAMPGIDPDPRKAVFRINRDIRFSKDKSPYKLHAAAYISPYGKKDPSFSGFYYQFGPEHLMLAGGLYAPDAATLLQVRRYMAAHFDEWTKITTAPAFIRTYGEVKGYENKRINDAALMEAARAHPILLKKQMYVEALLPPGQLTHPELLEQVLAHVHAGLPLFQFFAKACEQSAQAYDF